MKRMNQLYLLGCSLLLNSVALAADMDAPTQEVPNTQASVPPSWTTQQSVLGKKLIDAACNSNRARIEEILVQHPCLINFKDDDDWTALMASAYRGHAEIVGKLIAAGADVNAHNNSGETALMLAADQGRTEIVDRLIVAGAHVNTQDNDGQTALIMTAFGGRTEIVDRLIAAHSDVNAHDHDGKTALIRATEWGNVETVKALLAARALSTIPDNDGKTALEIAQKMKRTHIVELLQNHVDIEPEEETLMVKPAVD